MPIMKATAWMPVISEKTTPTAAEGEVPSWDTK